MSERGSMWRRLLDYWLGIPLVAASSLARIGKPAAFPAGFKPKQICFLCLGAIGDLLLLSGLITSLKECLPSATFTLFTSRANACAAPLVPGIDKVYSFALGETGTLIATLRRFHFDVFFDASQWARIGALIANLSNATFTVGFATEGQMRHFGYSIAVRHRSDQHECENFLDLGRTLYPNLSGHPKLTLPSCQSGSGVFSEICAKKNAVYLHMWASGIHAEYKEWPRASWAELSKRLTGAGYAVYLTGAPYEAKKNAAFLADNPDCGSTSIAGEVSFEELAALFSKARAVVSVNTGIMHLAAILGAPTIALNGPTNPLRWGPCGPRVTSLLPERGDCAYLNLGFEYKPQFSPCMTFLSVDAVLEALRSQGILIPSV